MKMNELTENVTAFEFGILAYIGDGMSVSLENADGQRTVLSKGGICCGETLRDGAVSEEEWNGFFNKLFSECGVMDYPEEFVRSDGLILDGEHWRMHIEFADGSEKNSGGNNIYPENWDRLMETIELIAK